MITGGPGSGKSTLIERLEADGHARTHEAGRGVIQDQMAIDGPGLPWRDVGLFAELMLSWELRSYHLASARPSPVFFDRGVPDVIGYLRLEGRPVPAHLAKAAATFRYDRVFIAPPWPEIYEQDAERRQPYEVAVKTYEAMVATYTDHGYDLVELPKDSPAARAAFVTTRCGPRG